MLLDLTFDWPVHDQYRGIELVIVCYSTSSSVLSFTT